MHDSMNHRLKDEFKGHLMTKNSNEESNHIKS